MSKRTLVDAFMLKEPHRTVLNTATDGTTLTLHGNAIAQHRADGLYVTLAGWNTVTTRDRLGYLPGVNVCTVKNEPYLNGEAWDGEWIKVNDNGTD